MNCFARFIGGLADLLFPPECVWCDVDLGPGWNGGKLCDDCVGKWASPAVHRCPKCAARVAETFRDGDCPWCRSHNLRFDRAWTLGPYDDALREAVLRTKHLGADVLVAALIDQFWQRHGESLQAERFDVVVPIPMHWFRRLRRGHNAPELAATLLARRLQIRDWPRGLVRRRSTNPQAGLSVPQRRTNVHNAFSVRRFYGVKGKRVLLVDDILTSGATCSEAARVLKREGAISVAVAVMARAQGET